MAGGGLGCPDSMPGSQRTQTQSLPVAKVLLLLLLCGDLVGNNLYQISFQPRAAGVEGTAWASCFGRKKDTQKQIELSLCTQGGGSGAQSP